MHPSHFAYHRVQSVDEAIALLAEHGDGAKLIAGGHSLLPIMKLRLAEPERLIDIGRIGELAGVRQDGDAVVIGALTTHHQVATDPVINAAAPLLAATAAHIGDRQVRNRGTIGGALAHADAASDYPAAILALEAEIVARGPRGERLIPAREFYVDFLTTALEPAEVLTEIRLPALSADHGWSYQKLANQASGYALVGVGAVVMLSERATCADIRIGITGTAPVAWRAGAAEEALRGQTLDARTVESVTARIDDGVDALGDLHASASYRRAVTRGLARRAVLEAAGRARQPD